jgi:hypothetical protein
MLRVRAWSPDELPPNLHQNSDVDRTLGAASYSNDTAMVCDKSISPGAGPAAKAGECDMTCTGNSGEPCGGPNRLSLFWSGQTGPETNPGPPHWAFSGCYT